MASSSSSAQRIPVLTPRQAPEAANQKRKRGRPAAASRDGQSVSQRQLTLTNNGKLAETTGETSPGEVDEDRRPKKRGRPARSEPEPLPTPELLPVAEGAGGNGSAPLKRKRGWPRGGGDEEEHREEDRAVTKHAGKKRGRPPPSQESAQIAESKPAGAALTTTATGEESSPKRRGRPAKKGQKSVGTDKDGADEEADGENEAQTSKMHSGRGGKAKKPPQVPSQCSPKPVGAKKRTKHTAELGEGEDPGPARKGRDRRKITSGSEDAQTWDGPAAGEIPRRRKAMKASKDTSAPEDASTSSLRIAPTALPRSTKRRRPPVEETPVKKAAAMSSEKQVRRGRSSPTQANVPTADAQKPRGRRPKEQHPEEDDAQETEEPSRKGQSKAKFSQQKKGNQPLQSQPEDREASPDEAAPLFRQLTTRTRRVPREVIDAKWSPLEPASISSVGDLLHSASRPVLLRMTNLSRHAEANAALNAVSKRLRSKLSRGLPFPPATTAAKREDELQFERTVDGVHSLEAQLDPLLHGVALLRKEKERAQRELEREYKVLHSLGANARAVGKERRDQLRKMHGLVPHPKRDQENKVENLRLAKPAENRGGKTFVGLESDELKSLAGQVGSHMESMRSNLQQIEGVSPAIAESRAALKMALMPHLDPSSYEQVLLG